MRSLLTVGCLLALSGCAIIVTGNDDVQVKSVFSSDAVAGNGQQARDLRAISAASAIDVRGPLDVDLRVGPAPSLTVEADSNLLPMIRTEVVGGTLRMWVEGNVRSANGLRVTATMPALSQVTQSGSGRLTISELKGAPLAFTKSGSGVVNLSGRVGRFDFQHSGSGHVNASALQTGDANVNLNGSGRMSLGQVHGSALSVNVHGSGSLQAAGTVASLTARVTGSGGVNLAAMTSEQADLVSNGSGDIAARVKRSLVAQSNGSGTITVYGNPVQREVSGKRVLLLN
ncbi:MAG: head GIN domain-containing protein [Pseudomonadota bacterium]